MSAGTLDPLSPGTGRPQAGGHEHRSRSGRRALRLALGITTAFMIVEFLGGLWTNSLALLADAGHMLTDVAALGLSLFAAWISLRPATAKKTYGYLRVEILAALLNGATLLVVALWIFLEAYHRLLQPAPIKTLEMLIIASLGLLANLTCIRILHGTHRHSLNIRGALLHVVGDALGSVGAIVASLSMLMWGNYWIDPLISVLVAALILLSAWRLVKDSVTVLLEGTPAHVSLQAMQEALSRVPGVSSVHDLHVWTLTSGMHAMTCHAVVEGDHDRHQILEKLSRISRERFNIHHTTIQLEEKDLCQGENRFCHEP